MRVAIFRKKIIIENIYQVTNTFKNFIFTIPDTK